MFSSTLVVELLVRITVVLVVGWAFLGWCRRVNPRWTIAVCRAMVVAALVLPLVYVLAPTFRVAVLPRMPASPTPAFDDGLAEADASASATQLELSTEWEGSGAGEVISTGFSENVPSKVDPQEVVEPSQPAIPPRAVRALVQDASIPPAPAPKLVTQVSWPLIALAVWFFVVLVLTLRLAFGVIRACRLIRRGVPCEESVLTDARTVADRLRIGRLPRILIVDGIDGPCSAGWMRSAVLLPATWMEKLSERERQVVLGHELTHIAGRDPAWDFLARCAAVLWWFHPLAWRLPLRHRLACEHVCDSAAADLAGDSAVYRRRLASWALEVYGEHQGMLATLTMADRSLLHRRLRWLEKPVETERVSRSRLAVLGLLAVVLLAAVATIRPVRRAFGATTLVEAVSEESGDGPEEVATSAENAPKQPPIVPPGKAAIDMSVTTPKIVRVVDEQEKPLVGARVVVGWWEDANGETVHLAIINPPMTDDQGEVTIEVPLGAVRVQISADAEDYVEEDGGQMSLEGDPVLALQRGRVIKVRAVDTEGNALPNAYALLAGSYGDRRTFTRDDSDVLVSSVVSLDRRWLRVIEDDESDEIPTRFSDLIDVTALDAAGADGVIEATLRPGVRLEGKLDDSVPRPIKNGQVDLAIVEGEGHQIVLREDRDSQDRPWQWRETVAVQPDGTFVCESLPPGGHVQLFALVEGYQSVTPTEAELRAYFREHEAGADNVIDKAVERSTFMPRIYALDRDTVSVTLPCKPTSGVDIRVVDPTGQPIEGATVSFSPNGCFLGGSTIMPGSWLPSRLKGGALLPTGKSWVFSAFVFPKTDGGGMVRVHSLPGEGRESYRVEADGFVMPINPTPSSLPIGAQRYALLELVSEEIQSRTITMERHLPRREREVLVVDHEGKPVPEVTLTITEITTSPEPDHWQQWSVQRFGNRVSEKSGENGRLALDCPVQIDGQAVPWVRVIATGRVGEDASVHSSVSLPTTEDGRVICLTRSEEVPRFNRAYRSVSVGYVKLDEVIDASPRQLLDKLIEKPDLAPLRSLFAASGSDAVDPIELVSAVRLNTNDSEYGVVLCRVRPRGATWVDRPPQRSPPQAALVFRPDGSLVTMLGGGFSARGSSENVMLTNLGGTGDYLVRVSASEEHGPFEYVSRWYRVGNESPSMTVHHYANSNSWSGANGNGKPTSEFGYLGYEFNGQDIDHTLPGVTREGLMVPRRILWDGLRNQFIGPVEQSFDGRPLYRVVQDASSEFLPLETKPNEVIVAGGRRDFSNWHNWIVVVQKSQDVTARLVLGADGKEEEVLLAATLASGQHQLQMQIDPAEQTDTESTVHIRIDSGENEPAITIPRMEIDARPSVPNQPVAVSQRAPVRLFGKVLADGQQSLVLRIDAVDAHVE